MYMSTNDYPIGNLPDELLILYKYIIADHLFNELITKPLRDD